MLLARDVLYFPHIDIQKSNWLRTALLTWETISTIVPYGYDKPYTNEDTILLNEADILRPSYVDRDYRVVEKASEIFMKFLETPESRRLSRLRIKPSEPEYFRIFMGKMSDDVRRELTKSFGAQQLDRDDSLVVDSRIGMIYMTLLASIMAKRQQTALWANNMTYRSLAERYIHGDIGDIPEGSTRLRQTLLTSIALQSVNISPKTSIKKLIEFRERYADERLRFRNTINLLSEALQGTYEDKEEFGARCNIIYKDHIEGALDDLRKALKAQQIVATVGILSIFGLARAATFLTTGMGVPDVPSAAISGGVSVGTQYINYRINRDALNHSSFSYVLHAEREFGRRKSGRH